MNSKTTKISFKYGWMILVFCVISAFIMLTPALTNPKSNVNLLAETSSNNFVNASDVVHPVAKEFAGGNGTAGNPYLIEDAPQLYKMAEVETTGDINQIRRYKLINTINLNGAVWTPVGVSLTKPFRGVFDGNNNYIIDINIHIKSNSGFFGVAYGATIRNFNIRGTFSNFFSGVNYENVGGIVGFAENSKIENTSSTVNLVNSDSNMGKLTYMGGIVGYAKNSTITKANNLGQINWNQAYYIGGVVGASVDSNISYAYNLADITSSKGNTIGGVAGFFDIGVLIDFRKLSYSYNSGRIEGNSEVGGILGKGNSQNFNSNLYYVSSVEVIHNYNFGNVFGVKLLGGIVGNSGLITILNCHNSGSVIGTEDSIGGITSHGGLLIKNVSNSGAIKGRSRIGGILGSSSTLNYYYGHIEYALNTGSVNATDSFAGGILGFAWGHGQIVSPTIRYSGNTGPITAANNDVGGIIGKASYSIDRSFNYGTITGKQGVGGLMGASEISRGIKISNSYNTGTIAGTGEYRGGLIGWIRQQYGSYNIENSYSTGYVISSSKAKYVGTLVGRNYSNNAKFTNTYFLEGSSGPDKAFGTSNGKGTNSSNGKPVKRSITQVIGSSLVSSLGSAFRPSGVGAHPVLSSARYAHVEFNQLLLTNNPTWGIISHINNGNPHFIGRYW